MTYYHVVIAQEFRKPVITEHRRYIGRYENVEIEEDGEIVVEQRKIDPDAWETYTEENRSRMALDISSQLHSFGNVISDLTNPNLLYVAEWDGKSPYVICHKGDYSARTMGYAGWPDITKEQYDALPIPAPL